MTDKQYKLILRKALDEYESLIEQREKLELQIAKKHQFIRATYNLLEEDDLDEFHAIEGVFDTRHLGLTEAIRRVLSSSPKKWFTATDVRNELDRSDFDFSRYTSNPLASVHSVLKRLKPKEAESTTLDGVMAWRWVGRRGEQHVPEGFESIKDIIAREVFKKK